MKILYLILTLLIGSSTFGQIQQHVNKTTGTESNNITEIDSIRFNGNQTEMEIILQNGTVQSHSLSTINNVTFSGNLSGTITSLNCASATNNGTLTAGVLASGVSSEIPYTGGNGGTHNGQTVNSTGVTGLTATLNAGVFANGSGSLTYAITGTPSAAGTANFAINIGGQVCALSLTVDLPVGTITSLNCASATNNGTLIEGEPASGVSSEIPYSGGNGGTHNGQNVNSTGVTGLTATLAVGTFASGSGSLTYTITGTPSNSGTASFTLYIGGQTCILQRTVDVNLTLQYPAGSVFCAFGPTAIVNVFNPTTGKVWMDRNLGAIQVASSNAVYFSYGDLYQWGRRADGHQCRTSVTTTTYSSTDTPPHGNFILGSGSPFDWRVPQNTNLWQGVNGINNPCPSGYRVPTEAELNAERASWSSNNAAGAFTSPLRWPVAGVRQGSSGSLGNEGVSGTYWSSTVSSTDARILGFNSSNASIGALNRANGYSVRCIMDITPSSGSILTLDCADATNNGIISGMSSLVPYTGGNGGTHSGQIVSSTGVTGLTATLSSGTFANGAGVLTYTITGTPDSFGTASFALNIGGQTCTLSLTIEAIAYPPSTVHCIATPTAVVDVTNPATGKTWMDRNLGASQIATSSTDTQAYGDLYQWGRAADGHQCRNSVTTSTLSSTDQPPNGNFILAPNDPNDWRNPQNNNLWQGVNGVNNPCPNGYRLPTSTELDEERLSWHQNNSAGALASPLKLPVAGDRLLDGSLSGVGTYVHYLSSTVYITYSHGLYFNSSNAYMTIYVSRGRGKSVRCIKN